MNIFAEFLPDFLQFDAVDGASLILLFGIILLLGSLGGKFFQKVKIPQVVGYIVIGILIGQSGFQVLSASVISMLNPISSIALAFIGFLIGGELKTSVLKKYGKQFTGILLFEAIVPFFTVSIIVTLISFLITKNIATSLAIGLVLGAISSATAPAATTDVLRENRTRGPLTSTVLGIVALDDAVALILYAVTASVASSLLGYTGGSISTQLLHLAYDVFASIGVGSLIGFLLSLVIKNIMVNEDRILTLSLGAILLSSGTCELLKLDTILAAMAMGFFMVNFATVKTRGIFSLVEKFTPPIYVLFFVLVGAKLNIWNITPYVALIALLYLFFRTAGKSIGARLGSIVTKAPITVKKYLPFCLLSQAGVAIGLSISAGQQFAETIGPTVVLIVTATTFVVQLAGPISVKYAVSKAGECGLDVCESDIMKSCCVKEVSVAGELICSTTSTAIVSETTRLTDILDSFSKNYNLNYVVKDQNDRLAGLITIAHLKESLQITEISDALVAYDIMEPCSTSISPEMFLDDVIKIFTDKDADALPVINDKGCVCGIIEKNTVEHYLHGKVVELQQKLASLG